ncbi:bifunctional 2',3'-cyclic-nucleotide 2'-phosphodiesterase/3'-nucleotidase [Paragemmobacter ruber]|uniref:Bifunctional 2',3'-cyclic-nucleotide 2'-phosphodiesterase/3'-nucleotidase n=1 Tax=Paragemmobacter ruber TaxID=1985673 RepID=A0ABW9Y326_9RHOB|nr:bifunctional 2',3'-cyclic-nucleotide 2'-phosphodiesterase/3'-nucleotidase [Rhodobacter ruber]NBE06928.1 bifunctional 2',3'-cyclic-nucleotide 2'-phosphodiesterase/3'-nucleotidase [Rhodobacter ruber]
MPTLVAMLRLLATSDLHAHAFGWDYHGDKPQSGLGLSDLAHLIDTARAECPNTLLVDNGDFLQGSPLGDWAAEQGSDRTHPMISAMNVLGYDAATLGNHEFSHGLPLLRRAIRDADFPFVSANLRPLDNGPFAERSILIDRVLSDGQGKSRPIRIGITGVAPPQTVVWEANRIDGQVAACDAVPAATHAVNALRDAGADVVILLAHTGLGEVTHHPGMENVAQPLARLSGADAMVMGHTHLIFPAPEDGSGPTGEDHLGGTPAVMPGFFGSHLGLIDLTMRHDGSQWSLSGGSATLLPTAPAARPHHGLQRACGAAHEATRNWLSRQIGHSDIGLQSYFAQIAPCHTMRLVAAAQAWHVRQRLAETPLGDLPILSSTAPFRAGGRGGPDNFTDIPPGPLELRHATDIYPFPNTVVALRVTGAELEGWLERAVIQFATIDPDQTDQPLVRPDSPSFDLDLIAGLTFAIDVTEPPRFDARGVCVNAQAHRIRDLTRNGRPIAPDEVFILATNSYRAAGSGGFPGCWAERIVLDDKTATRAALVDYLAGANKQDTMAEYDWTFRPVGTRVTFDTSPRAAAHLRHIARLNPEPAAGAGPGYLRFHLHL